MRVIITGRVWDGTQYIPVGTERNEHPDEAQRMVRMGVGRIAEGQVVARSVVATPEVEVVEGEAGEMDSTSSPQANVPRKRAGAKQTTPAVDPDLMPAEE